MKVLLDTHLVLWWEAGNPRLPGKLIPLVDQADAVFVSRASLWEIAIRLSLGKLRLEIATFADCIGEHGFEWLDITNRHLIKAAALPLFEDHKDPFDRLLVAQSLIEPLQFLTVDKRLARYGEMVRVL